MMKYFTLLQLFSFQALLTGRVKNVLAAVESPQIYHPTPLNGEEACPSEDTQNQTLREVVNAIENSAVSLAPQEPTTVMVTDCPQTQPDTCDARLDSFREEVYHLVTVGNSSANPADSCGQIHEYQPNMPSGDYWVRNAQGNAVQVYCDMTRQCCNDASSGGWARVAYLDMTNPAHQCPTGWDQLSTPRGCIKRGITGCSSAMFQAQGILYSRICGRVIGYQYCNPDAFLNYNLDPTSVTIDDIYLDGVSITRGSPRQHVWSFAVGTSETETTPFAIICSCTNSQNLNRNSFLVPTFVGDDYFCETAQTASNRLPCPTGNLRNDAPSGVYVDDPLWDGQNCGINSSCCQLNGPPWFCKELDETTNDAFEVRICDDATIEDVMVIRVEIYVR